LKTSSVQLFILSKRESNPFYGMTADLLLYILQFVPSEVTI
jgi:hypothetical protein